MSNGNLVRPQQGCFGDIAPTASRLPDLGGCRLASSGALISHQPAARSLGRPDSFLAVAPVGGCRGHLPLDHRVPPPEASHVSGGTIRLCVARRQRERLDTKYHKLLGPCCGSSSVVSSWAATLAVCPVVLAPRSMRGQPSLGVFDYDM